MKNSIERVGVALIASLVPSIVLVHGLGTITHALAGGDERLDAFLAVGIVAASGLVQAALLLATPGGGKYVRALMVGLAAAAVSWITGSSAASFAMFLGVAGQGLGMEYVVRILPEDVDGAFQTKRLKAIVWTLLGLLAVVQTARLSAYATDIEKGWYLTTDDVWWTDHMCLSAYVYAAELQQRGEENVYDAAHYPGLTAKADPSTGIKNLAAHIEDPYQYPPQFLLLPLGGMLFTSNFYVMRSVWFAIQVLAFLAAFVWLARWVGGGRGRAALWSLPAVLASVPVLQNFQYGQYHLMPCLLAVVGMALLERGRRVTGGALLGVAVVTKIFPGLLLVPLVASKRWRDLGSVVASCAIFTGLGWAVMGSAPFESFFEYLLPRMESGAAFDFESAWPEIGDDALMINLSVARAPEKLAKLGMGWAEGTGQWASRVYLALLAVLAWTTTRRHTSNASQLCFWFALLNLFVLQGGAGWSDYVPAPSLWLLALLAVELGRGVLRTVLYGVCWVVFFLVLGTQPMPDRAQAPLGFVAGLLMTGLIIALSTYVAVRRGDTASDTFFRFPRNLHPPSRLHPPLEEGTCRESPAWTPPTPGTTS